MSEIKRLQMLLELDRLGTVSEVASTFAYSTSAVSQQLSQLERDFGAPLLEPDGRRLRFTPQGEVLLQHAARLVADWESAQSAVAASLEDVTGSLSVVAFETACLAIVPHLVRTITDEHPDARITMVQADAEEARSRVLAREIDLAITERYPGQTYSLAGDLVDTELFDDPMLLAVPEDSPDVAGVEDVADMDWVVEMPGSPAREWAVATCRRAGFEPRIAYQTSDVLVHANLARAGLAAAFIPALTPEHMLGGVRLVDFDPDQVRTVYAISRSSQHGQPLMAAVLGILSRGRPTAH